MISTSDVICELHPHETRQDPSSCGTRKLREVELRPETHQFLMDEADAVGVSVEQYAAILIEEYATQQFPARETDYDVV
jgi:predicted HicB family RNase H-like nuclease